MSKWKFFFSRSLDMKGAIHSETGEIRMEDKTKYSPEEVELYRKSGRSVSPQDHAVKRAFDGEVVYSGIEKKR